MLSKIQTKIAAVLIGAALLVVPVVAVGSNVSAQTPKDDQITNNLCQGTETLEISTTGASAGSCATSDQAATDTVNNIITTIINVFSIVVGIVAVIMIIVGGLKYITSGGDSGKVTSAKNSIIYAIIGLVIVALAQVIVRFVLAKSTSV